MPTATKNSHHLVKEWLSHQEKNRELPEITVIVPAFNEEWRLPPTLIDIIDFFDAKEGSYEIIVVDDGSRDNTSKVVKKFSRVRPQVRLVRLPKNYGKGHAIRTGVQNARGLFILFTDADGSTPIAEFDSLKNALKECDIAIGSRAIKDEEVTVTTSALRKYLGRMFNAAVNLILLPEFRDTQCGFKLFRAPVARFLFDHQQADGFSFDCEILFLANKATLSIQEVPVNWTNVPGSKVNLVVDAIKMLRDLFVFRIRHSHVTHQDFERFLSQDLQDLPE